MLDRIGDFCSPSILSVDPAVGNPVGDAVKIGLVERHAVAEFAFVGLQIVAWPPEIELQHLVGESAAATRRIARRGRRLALSVQR